MKPSELPAYLDLAYQTRSPVMIWGAPGIGKSKIINQWATAKRIPVIDRRLSQMEPSDLIGLPSIIDSRTHWSMPCWFPQSHIHGAEGVLLLDEITSAPPQMSAAAYQLVLDRMIGDHRLPDGWIVIAAGNRTQDRGVVHSMPAPLANRFEHVPLEPDLDDLRAYAFSHGWDVRVPSFLAFRPNLLHAFDARSADPAFPTPRTWEKTSQKLQLGIPSGLEYQVVSGQVGQGAATEFLAFLRMAEQITPPDVVIKNPSKAKLPGDAGICYAMMGALAAKTTKENFSKVMTYLGRIDKNSKLGSEFVVLFMTDIQSLNESLIETPEFEAWATDPSNMQSIL